MVFPVVKEFYPEFIVISAGLDALKGDPIGEFNISPNCYIYMLKELLKIQ